MHHWHQLDTGNVCEELKCDPAEGLAADEVAARQDEYGVNELVQTGGRGPWRILWEQISGAMVLLLFVAAGVSLALGEHLDAGGILVIIVLNAALGFFQDYRAERALASLMKLAAPTVRVRRGGAIQEVSARTLVPGDIVLLEAGNFVPADARLIQVVNLKVQEAALTGESAPIEKSTERLEGDVSLADRHNMVFSGTVTTYGHGEAIVTAIGMQTELGHIARMLQAVEREPTPLQRRLAQLGRTLAAVALGIVAVFFGLGVLLGEPPGLMLRTALSLAVAIVPEGLPAVATVTLAIGARRMFEQQALIRKLPAVETLGSVTVICSDKTGTLTQNSMTVTVLHVAGKRFELRDAPHEEPANPTLSLLLTAAALCNDAILEPAENEDRATHLVGDPTETSLVAAAEHFGLSKPALERIFPRVAELPFDSDRKRMTTVHRADTDDVPEPVRTMRETLQIAEGDRLAFSKGGVDSLLDVSNGVWIDGEAVPLDEDWRRRILEVNDRLAQDGMRVLGVAFKRIEGDSNAEASEEMERDLIFVGMEAMIDPPRSEAQEAVSRCRTAGIRPVMITGDHPLTAGNIARQLGINEDGDVLTGRDLATMADEDFENAVRDVSIYARVTPEHKLRIVQALQRQGEIVAMTGDGVNDAPALRQAEIGVAMGITGTDVSKEASEMVLLDDNFASIVNAVEQGRIVYDNIRKFVKYTMTSNAGEVWVMLFGPLLGMPLPLLPLQILWVNLVTDGLPGLALGLEPAERETMQRPPRPPHEHILNGSMAVAIVWVGLLMGFVSIGMGYWFYTDAGGETAYWRTIVFTVLTLSQMGNALAVRSERDSLFRIGLFSNMALLGSVLLTLVLQIAVIYAPPLQRVFRTVSLSAADLAMCLAASSVVFVAIEMKKWIQRRRGTD